MCPLRVRLVPQMLRNAKFALCRSSGMGYAIHSMDSQPFHAGSTLRRRGSVSEPEGETQRGYAPAPSQAHSRAALAVQGRQSYQPAEQRDRRPLLSNRARRAETIAGICLVVASLCHLASSLASVLVQGEEGDSPLLTVHAHLNAWSISQAALFASLVLLVPAVLALVCLLWDHGVGYGLAGGVLALFGVLASTVDLTIGLVVEQMAQVDEQAAMEALLGRILSAVFAPFDTLVTLLPLGMLVIMVGLCQRGMALGSSVLLLAIGTVAGFIGLSFSGSVFKAVAEAWLGFALLSWSSEKTGTSTYESQP